MVYIDLLQFLDLEVNFYHFEADEIVEQKTKDNI